MKNKRYERLGIAQKQYHRNNQWRLNGSGLYVPHSYAEKKESDLTWWDDVGFILNGKRVIVWFQHPRYIYENAINDLSWKEVGDGPDDDWLFDGCTTNYVQVGASRKKIVSYTSRSPSDEQQSHYDRLDASRKRMSEEGIPFDVPCSFKRERLSWAMGVSLIAPMEVRNENDLKKVAELARRLVLGQTTLESEFPGYIYGKADWLAEQKKD